MEKVLGRYTAHWRTNRWTPTLFFNIMDIAALYTSILHAADSDIVSYKSENRPFFAGIKWDIEPSSNFRLIAKCTDYKTFFD